MSFYPQPDNYSCGPFSLKHAMNIFGVFKSDGLIIEKSGARWWSGVDEVGLDIAARAFNFKLEEFQTDSEYKALVMLNKNLKKNYPCILCVDDWRHWITVVNHTKSEYVVINSGEDKVFYTLNSQKLLDYWGCYIEEDKNYSFDGYALIPNFKAKTIAKFTPKKAQLLMYSQNKDLALHWEEYFSDITIFSVPLNDFVSEYLTFSSFLKKYEKLIINKIAFWHGSVPEHELKKIINNMEFVAEIYNLVILNKNENKAIIDLTSLLMMYACGTYGMAKFY
ncbi:MAG: hypothetical protein V1773_19215 [bacterium]